MGISVVFGECPVGVWVDFHLSHLDLGLSSSEVPGEVPGASDVPCSGLVTFSPLVLLVGRGFEN